MWYEGITEADARQEEFEFEVFKTANSLFASSLENTIEAYIDGNKEDFVKGMIHLTHVCNLNLMYGYKEKLMNM